MNPPDDEATDRPLAGLSALKDVTPPPSLVPAVMRRIAEPRPASFWSWLRRPRRIELSLSPLGALGGLAATGLLIAGLGARQPTPGPVIAKDEMRPLVLPAVPKTDDRVMVRFVLVARGAQKVAVAGDFNGWSPADTVLENSDGNGTFVATVRLPRGAHEYMFVVDGEWVTDPTAPEVRPDGFGRRNAVLRL